MPAALVHVLVRTALLLLLASASADDVTKGNFGAAAPVAPSASAPKAKRSTYPYSGQLESHDARSITLSGKRKTRVLLLTPATRVLRNGNKTSLETAAAGEYVSGSTSKNAEGKEEAITINLKGTQAKRARSAAAR